MISLDEQSRFPLYKQLSGQIKAGILNGDFPVGQKAPSIRKLSQDLGVSKNVVKNAYALLQSEGLITNKPRSGYYVKGPLDSDLNSSDQDADPWADLSLNRELLTQCYAKEICCRHLNYDFTVGSYIPDNLPFAEWKKLTNRCLRNYQHEIASYRRNMGERGLRQEILKYLRTYRNIDCTVDQISIGAGTHHCLASLCALLNAQSPFSLAMEAPGLISIKKLFNRYGADVHLVPSGGEGLDMGKLRSTGAKAVLLSSSHQVPAEPVMPPSCRIELLRWAGSEDAWIIEDGDSEPFKYKLGASPSFQSLAPDKVIYLGSFSEAMFPSLRIAYMVLPPRLSARYEAIFGGDPSPVPFLAQKTLEIFMKEGHWERHLRIYGRKLERNHDCLIECLNREFRDKITICGAIAGFQLMLQINWPESEKELVTKAYQAGVGISPASVFYCFPSVHQAEMITLNFCGIRLEDIPAGVEALRKAWLDR